MGGQPPVQAQVWKVWEKEMSTWNFNSNPLCMFGNGLWRLCLVVACVASLLGTVSATSLANVHTFSWRKGDFHFKIRKYWKAQFGPLSHPLFTLLKGRTIDLIDESREEGIPGITSYIPVGRGAWP